MVKTAVHSISVGTGGQLLYFKTTDCYDAGVGTKTGIAKLANPEGDEELIPVKELLRTGRLIRAQIQYESNGKKKTGSVLVARNKMGDVLSDEDAKQLKGETFKIGTVVKGTIKRTYLKRDASFY